MLLKVFVRNVYFGRYLKETWHAFIVYMFRRQPEVLHSVVDNALISGFGKGPIHLIDLRNKLQWNVNWSFHSSKFIWNSHLQHFSHFAQGPISFDDLQKMCELHCMEQLVLILSLYLANAIVHVNKAMWCVQETMSKFDIWVQVYLDRSH